jgi:hypothetical protein
MILDCGYTMRLRAHMNDLSNSRCRQFEITTETPEHLWTCSGMQKLDSLPFSAFAEPADPFTARFWLIALNANGVYV